MPAVQNAFYGIIHFGIKTSLAPVRGTKHFTKKYRVRLSQNSVFMYIKTLYKYRFHLITCVEDDSQHTQHPTRKPAGYPNTDCVDDNGHNTQHPEGYTGKTYSHEFAWNSCEFHANSRHEKETKNKHTNIARRKHTIFMRILHVFLRYVNWLKLDHWIWRRFVFMSTMYFHFYLPFEKGCGTSLVSIWIPFTQRCFVPNMVEIGLVVLEKKILKCW